MGTFRKEEVRTIVPTQRPIKATSSSGDQMKQWLAEIDEYFEHMQDFNNQEPDEIFRSLSGWTARMSHIRSVINRNESKLLQAFRTKQVDPFLLECERQFKMWSRVFSVQSMDWNMQGRQT